MALPNIGDLVDGRFRIERKLGEGGTSVVYEVRHVVTDKRFAIKWLLPELASDEVVVERFIHEARVGGRFAHPDVVQVYDICEANGSLYMLLELLEGESLQARLERVGRFSVADASRIVLHCAQVLQAAHEAGIVHRDFKPGNIFLCRADAEGREVPKLLDFGVSKSSAKLQDLALITTATGSVVGTPLYMSPEQMLGQSIDQRTDIYGLGVVLYELVSGRPPYQADSYGELVVRVTVEARPQPLAQIAQVDEAFAAVVARAMAREADARYASVEEFAQALAPFAPPPPTAAEAAEPNEELSATPAAQHGGSMQPSELARAPRAVRSRRIALAVTLGACAALALFVFARSSPVAPVANRVRPAAVRKLDSASGANSGVDMLTERAPQDALVRAERGPDAARKVAAHAEGESRGARRPSAARSAASHASHRPADPGAVARGDDTREPVSVRNAGARSDSGSPAAHNELALGSLARKDSPGSAARAHADERTDAHASSRDKKHHPAERTLQTKSEAAASTSAHAKSARQTALPPLRLSRSDFEDGRSGPAPPPAAVSRHDF